ncbi:hypothetical protein M0765_023675 [Variovorax sp. S2]|jgi:hypothetical protein|uniref:hypothetical protein n=1 Tax=Variovorax sp. S12S4 TaxID=3029170 RepID=UPI00215BEF00|nr:hypothetical protein [Variovorax sp. S12S4]MCR8960618.1 hypothetical protein [Variovorax sp. S12S4]
MALSDKKLNQLRRKITEGLRIQRDTSEPVPYMDSANVVGDVCSKQNHTIFARRGCGKTLLLHHSTTQLAKTKTRSVYLNCEDFKRHSFPNVLIEILDALFRELEKHLHGWFGRSKASKLVVQNIRAELASLRSKADVQDETLKATSTTGITDKVEAGVGGKLDFAQFNLSGSNSVQQTQQTERSFSLRSEKLKELDVWLPRLKEQVREVFERSSTVTAVFLQIDDLYHLKKSDQPFVIDYIHRLCKDLPLYFKIATLRHASSLYMDLDNQPIGAQERHDYQPINIDYTFADFPKTREQNRKILNEFGKAVGISAGDIGSLFKGAGFDRLVMAGGGVPRDTLSLFLEVLSTTQSEGNDKIGKDDVRLMSKSNFEKRIEELKQDSEGGEQDVLMRGIYVIREFCLSKGTNAFLVSEKSLQQNDNFRHLIYRLLDYRIIHSTASALTHKSQAGTFQGFVVDIGCYAHLRKLDGRFSELDVSADAAKDQLRSAPILDEGDFKSLFANAPANVEGALLADDPVEA